MSLKQLIKGVSVLSHPINKDQSVSTVSHTQHTMIGTSQWAS